jgi:hypothetical protein
MKVLAVLATALLVSAGMTSAAIAQQGGDDMTYFVTSTGKGNGADLGGLEGADAHCNALANAAGSKRTSWKAYLSTTLPGGDAGVNARDRIGEGPWRNAKGVVVGKNVADLHSAKNNINKQTALTEKGETVKGRGDTPNEHDILTGSDPAGMYSTAGGDTTCGNSKTMVSGLVSCMRKMKSQVQLREVGKLRLGSMCLRSANVCSAIFVTSIVSTT